MQVVASETYIILQIVNEFKGIWKIESLILLVGVIVCVVRPWNKIHTVNVACSLATIVVKILILI